SEMKISRPRQNTTFHWLVSAIRTKTASKLMHSVPLAAMAIPRPCRPKLSLFMAMPRPASPRQRQDQFQSQPDGNQTQHYAADDIHAGDQKLVSPQQRYGLEPERRKCRETAEQAGNQK